MAKKSGRPPRNGRRAMTAAERQRLYRRRKNALAKQREVTIVAGVGRIALHQVNEARPIAYAIAGSVIKLNDELKLEAPSMRKLLRLAKTLGMDAMNLQLSLCDHLAKTELEKAKQEVARKRPEDDSRLQQSAGAESDTVSPHTPSGLDIAGPVHLDYIMCLEDGQKVLDLAAHLDTLGMTPNAYKKKWGLPDAYPMQAPDLIFEQGPTFEYDPGSGQFRRVQTDDTIHPQRLIWYF